jgi:hypothetical protein
MPTEACPACQRREAAMARPAGLEPATYGFEVRRSIQLSYGRTKRHHIIRHPSARSDRSGASLVTRRAAMAPAARAVVSRAADMTE